MNEKQENSKNEKFDSDFSSLVNMFEDVDGPIPAPIPESDQKLLDAFIGKKLPNKEDEEDGEKKEKKEEDDDDDESSYSEDGDVEDNDEIQKEEEKEEKTKTKTKNKFQFNLQKGKKIKNRSRSKSQVHHHHPTGTVWDSRVLDKKSGILKLINRPDEDSTIDKKKKKKKKNKKKRNKIPTWRKPFKKNNISKGGDDNGNSHERFESEMMGMQKLYRQQQDALKTLLVSSNKKYETEKQKTLQFQDENKKLNGTISLQTHELIQLKETQLLNMSEITKLTGNKNNSERKISRYDVEVDELKKRLETVQSHNLSLLNKINEFKQKRDVIIQHIKQKKSELKKKEENLERANQSTKEKIGRSESDIVRLKNNNKSLLNEIKTLKLKLFKIKTEHSEVVEGWSEKHEVLKREDGAKSKRIRELESLLSESKKANLIPELKANNASLKKEVFNKKRELAEFATKINELKSRLSSGNQPKIPPRKGKGRGRGKKEKTKSLKNSLKKFIGGGKK